MKRTPLFTLALILALLVALFPSGPALALDLTVNSANDVDDGTCDAAHCSLREALNAAEAHHGPDLISFNIPGAGIHSIQPGDVLPSIVDGDLIINGYSQPGAAPATESTPATILIEIDGTSATDASGFRIHSANNMIRGLAINRFEFIGIYISGPAAVGNSIIGNYIGLDPEGLAAHPNGTHGVFLGDGASSNLIGGDEPGERNVISGNTEVGIVMWGAEVTNNIISGNYIGTNPTGLIGLGNTRDGIWILDGSSANRIGGEHPGERNLISGNQRDGIRLTGMGTDSNLIRGNTIGLDVTNETILANAQNGISIMEGSSANMVIGEQSNPNLISGNGANGIEVKGPETNGNVIERNIIGGTSSGALQGNGGSGVMIWSGAFHNWVGGDETFGNFIGGNAHGVLVDGLGSDDNEITDNYINNNDFTGVMISLGAQRNTVGPRNAIIKNGHHGIWVIGENAVGNIITQNMCRDNVGLGIRLEEGGNNELPAPVITSTTTGVQVNGTACPFCQVEIFMSPYPDDVEGLIYMGSSLAGSDGSFSVRAYSPSFPYITFPYLTATATNTTDGTSEFSATFVATVVSTVYLPVLIR